MINPKEITDYHRNDWDLQEFFMFSVAVAGKKSDQTAKKIQVLTDEISEEMGENPYYDTHLKESGILHYLLGIDDEPEFGVRKMEAHKFGKYNQWKSFFEWWIRRVWDLPANLHVWMISDFLRRASVEQLERIPSVGKKTARFFKLHTDRDAKCVPLDTHILKFIKSHRPWCDNIPSTTPQSDKKYKKLEDEAHKLMTAYMKRNYLSTLAEADLAIWKSYAY